MHDIAYYLGHWCQQAKGGSVPKAIPTSIYFLFQQQGEMMKTLLTITLLIAGIASSNAIAEEISAKDKAAYIENNGAPAGDMATGYAVGGSAAIGVSAISVLAGIALATLNPGGSNTSTTTTTSTIAGK
jgi:hypothetical protein